MNKVAVWGFAVAVLAYLPVPFNFVMSLLQPKPDIHVDAAFYAYEKAFILTGETKTFHYEMRNLVSNCLLWRTQVPLPKGRAKTADPQSWVLSKFQLENVSSSAITNLRIGIMSPLLKSTTELSATPNVQATAKLESSSNDSLHTYVISISTIAPLTSTILSLQTPIDDNLRQFLYGQDHKVSTLVPFLSADQFGTLRPKLSKMNAMEMVEREAEI